MDENVKIERDKERGLIARKEKQRKGKRVVRTSRTKKRRKKSELKT